MTPPFQPAPATDPLFRFGIVADPQYADIPPNPATGRYYASSLARLGEAIERFNTEDLAFVMTLGDIIDRDWASFDAILPLYDRLRHPRFFVPGNHDFQVTPEYLGAVHRRLGMPAPWYDFALHGFRFIALDGNDVSLFSSPPESPKHALAQARLATLQQAGAVNAQTWNASLGEEQFAWLGQCLHKAQAAGERVVVMGHYPLYPENDHNMWDAPRIVDLLTGFDCFTAYFCGHNHDGNFGVTDGQYFVNFKGMVDTPEDNSFAVVDAYADRFDIRGFGREETRTLPFAPAGQTEAPAARTLVHSASR